MTWLLLVLIPWTATFGTLAIRETLRPHPDLEEEGTH